jgi:CrcB protein
MERLAAVGLGGALGSCARYLLGGFVQRLCGPTFPADTLSVNVLGSYLIGLVMQVSLETQLLSPTLRIAIANMGVTLLACLVACWLGFATARALVFR